MVSFLTYAKFKTHLFILIFTSSIIITIASTGFQLYFEFRNSVKDVESNLQFVGASYLSTISDRLWDFDISNVRLQLRGILKLPGIRYCAISGLEETNGARLEEGDPEIRRDLAEEYKLFYNEQPIGILTIAANFDHIFDGLRYKSIVVLASRGLEVFVIATIILLIINQVLFRHFTTISTYARNLDIDHLHEPLTLQRPMKNDELQLVVAAINDMRIRIQKDIEERRTIQKQLEYNHNVLKAQQNTSWEGILIVDEKDRIISHNRQFIDIWEIPEDKISSGFDKPLINHVLGKLRDPEGFKSRIRYLYANRDETSKDIIHFLDGRVIERRSGPIYGTHRTYFGRVWYFRDITQQVIAEQSLMESHERFLKVLNSVDATIYVADMETHEILFMNKHMIETFGRDMIGEKCWKSFRDESGPCKHCTNDQLVDANGNPTEVCIWKDKNPVTGRLYVNHDRAIEWTDGRFVRIQVATDITEVSRIEEQLRQAQKMESVGRLAGGVAHDFNNMLSIILGNTEMIIQDMGAQSPHIDHVLEIQKATERSIDITRQLLAYARKQTIAPRVLDLNETIDGMFNMLRRLIGENIDVAWLPKNNLWAIKIDPSQVDQILANLCVNARDSIKDVGKVTIETDNVSFDEDDCLKHRDYKPGDYVMLSVSDNGCGMGKEVLDNLFEPFFTTKSISEGTGLGLATVYGIIKQNNGFIHVYSEPNMGSTFRIYFPRQTLSHRLEQNQVCSDPGITCDETILLVEDEPSILTMTTSILERQGYTVLAASNPTEAIQLAASHAEKINLLMTDVVMPEMNGRDLAKKIYKRIPGLKCLFMSGYTANVIAHHGVLDFGMQFIQKPFSLQGLTEKVRKVLDEEIKQPDE